MSSNAGPEPLIHVLLVDDDPDAREITRAAFEAHGHPVRIIDATDGRSAIDYLRGSARIPDAILLDLHMPVLDGTDVLRAIRGDPVLDRIPIVMLTSSTSKQEHALCRELGANVVLTKDMDKIRAAVRALTGFRPAH